MCGSTAGVMDAGLLLLIEMGQSYMLFRFQERNPRSSPAKMHTEDASLWSTASSATPESSPILAHIGPIDQDTTQAARFLDRAVVLPERQHKNGNEDADDADDAQGGLLRLVVEMGKSALTSQGNSHAGLLEPLKQQFLNALRGPGATGGYIGFA